MNAAALPATLAALTRRVLRSEPGLLERGWRSLLIHLHHHLSDAGVARRSADAAGQPLTIVTPTQFRGRGTVEIGRDVVFGVVASPESWSCSYFEARTREAAIRIGAGTVFNNRAQLISEGAGITIGARCLFGTEVMVVDSNFHGLALEVRSQPDPQPRETVLEDDVFVGARAIVLKGARIGRGSVIAALSLVPPGFVAPPMSIVAGNPARVVGSVQ